MTNESIDIDILDQPKTNMKSKQLQTLIRDSELHFQEKHFKKALNSAQIAYDFGIEMNAQAADLWRVRLILSNIYYTNGKYQSKTSFFQKALTYLEQIELADIIFNTKIAAFLLLGKTNQALSKLDISKSYFQKAFQLSQQNSFVEGIIKSLIGLSQNAIKNKHFDTAFQLAEDSLTFLKKSNKSEDELLLAEVYNQLSETHIWRKEYSKSLTISQILLNISKKIGDTEREIGALKNIALVCGVKSNYKIGMQYYLEALDKSEEIGYRPKIAQILINIGTIYAHLYNYKEAIKRYERVLSDYEDILSNRNRVVVYNNLGNIYYKTEEIESAKSYFESAYQLAIEFQYKEMIAHALAQLSRTELKVGNFNATKNYTKKAEDLFQDLGDINGRQIHLLNLATIEAEAENLEGAISLAEESLELAKKLEDNASEISAYKMLGSFHKLTGNFEKALDYQIIYSKIQEEFARLQRSRQFLDMEIRHAIREKQREIEQLTKENEYQGLLLEKTDQIARQNQELIRANGELRQFAYVASHDLKEPLRMIGAYSKIIKKGIGEHLDEKHSQYFGYITDGVDRMNALLDALLQYATVGNSGERVDLIDLNFIVELCQINLKVHIEENEATIHATELPKIQGTKTLLLQLMQNLISNAIKFKKTATKSEIFITAKEDNGNYVISVKDNGIGISEEDQSSVFEIFQRLNTRTDYEGTGIGLAICKKIVDRLNGRIWLESEKGVGTTFYFSVPK